MMILVKTIKYLVIAVLSLLIVILSTVYITGKVTELPGEKLTPQGSPRNISQYITMPDGVKIAADIWFPEDFEAGKAYPTALRMTRYWRATEVSVLQRGLVGLGLMDLSEPIDYLTWFNQAGYIVVKVDARGSGASFGFRKIELAREEIQDYGNILEWIGIQKWSNGKVGSFGVSYDGNTAESIITTGKPQLKIAAPLYDDFNPFLGLMQPGGARNVFLPVWGESVHYQDQNDVCGAVGLEGFSCLLIKALSPGVKPVDGYEDLLPLAVKEHQQNLHMVEGVDGVSYLDDVYGTSGYRTKDYSPYGQRVEIEKADVPMIIHVGWSDSGTVDGALSRFMTFANAQHVVIGPFSHGGKYDTDHLVDFNRPVSPTSEEQYQSLIDYFDAFLKGDTTTLTPHKQIRYYTMGSGDWSTTEVWPPVGFSEKTYYLGDNQQLVENLTDVAEASDGYVVDFTVTNGTLTRWHTSLDGGDVVYDNRVEQAEKSLHYTSTPLKQTIEITGTPTVSLYVASSHRDNLFIAYLEDVSPDGRVSYITEGILRADNRQITDRENLPYKITGAAPHSYSRTDALPMVPGEVANISFDLFPISAQVKVGHKLRVSIVGADSDAFSRWPKEGIPEWTVYKGGVKASQITIPYKNIQ